MLQRPDPPLQPIRDARTSWRLVSYLSVIGFVTALSTRAVDPLVPPIAADLGVAPEKVALLATAFALPFALVQPVLGPVADMLGKIRLMIACVVVLSAASFVSAIATDYSVLLASRILAGIASGGIFPVGIAVIGDLIPVKERQIALGRWLAVVIGGNLLGASAAGLIGDLFGWRAVFVVVGVFCAAAFVSAVITLRRAAGEHRARFDLAAIPAGYRGIFANPRAKVCFSAVFLEGIAVFGLFPFVALLLLATGEGRALIAGLVVGAFSLGGIGYSLTVRTLIGRLRPAQMMVIGGALAATALAVAALGLPWPVQFAAFCLLGAGFYLLHASIQVHMTELSVTARATATSVHSSFFFLGHATGPVLYGLGFGAIGPTASIAIGAAIMLMVGIACARLLGERGRES